MPMKQKIWIFKISLPFAYNLGAPLQKQTKNIKIYFKKTIKIEGPINTRPL